MRAYIQSCKSRDYTPVAEQLREVEIIDSITPFIDMTDFYATRNAYRLTGCQQNYIEILKAIAGGDDPMPLIIQDDVKIIDPKLMNNCLSRIGSGRSIIMFYCLRNSKTEEASKSGQILNRANWRGFYPVCHIFPRETAKEFLEWYYKKVENEDYHVMYEPTPSGGRKVCGEDWAVQTFMKERGIPMYWHFPLLVSHGSEKSVLGNNCSRKDWE